ncbi:bifunctional 2-polyprenyl-6-hydroxyphenol methylase/3-demethylubiquinol 3-O-methyltransferase UbiG [Zobellia sp. 1_MG-2023]|uniref:class I SAM-dependent methyltransferase n=1 Tax=Zobellia sp. 1_MG-2023 TaxID=3062626 RepID=UPI0026E2AA2B|nr:class I SAM-dependent methyltransferase [Zobellia sp. 1_MG-2023]MDO6820260.1 class I SAM-dependent methyltransferase [Zobellia sp. 1_MG-2023]
MAEFWEDNFVNKQEMWGLRPAKSALLARDLFVGQSAKNILVPGVGYGRNAQLFVEEGMQVTGIEISKTAIELAKKHYGNTMSFHCGSVGDMPFDDVKYDGIFCYALIHLLDVKERTKLIQDCYNQLTENGTMVFTAITKDAPNFGKGKLIGQDRYEFHQGVQLFYYDKASVQTEFEKYGLFKITEIEESQPMYFIECKKTAI